MDFFGIGFGEITLILVLALVIWGPGRVVELAKTLGKLVRTLKKMSSDFTAQVSRELGEEEKKPRPELQDKITNRTNE